MPTENVAERTRPPLLELPEIAARRKSGPMPPAAVRSAADLPDRLFVGDLVPESFEVLPRGWRARYEDAAPETWAKLEFVRGKPPLLRVSAAFRGSDGFASQTPASGFGSLAHAAIVLPQPWLAALRERLAGLEIDLFDAPGGADFIGTFPDGWLMKIIVPVAVRDLSRIGVFHRCVEADPQRSTAVRSMLRPWSSWVEYAVGRSPVAAESPDAVAARIADEWGLPQIEAPAFFDHPEGPRVLRVRRHHFNLDVTTPFRDFERVVHALAESGLVMPVVGDRAPERRALAAQAPLLERGQRVQLYALDRSLRVVHLPPTTAHGIEPTFVVPRREDLDAFLGDIQRSATPQRDRT